jgi:transcriptional antiterminator NusG
MPNVLGFLGGLDNPTPVRQADINRILGTADETVIKNEESFVPYSVDDAVKVTDGPFNGFNGIIEEVDAAKHKLKVMVKIFGRKTPLELSFNQVEKE